MGDIRTYRTRESRYIVQRTVVDLFTLKYRKRRKYCPGCKKNHLESNFYVIKNLPRLEDPNDHVGDVHRNICVACWDKAQEERKAK